MGLKEKRIIEVCQKEMMPTWQKKVQAACGTQLEWTVQWEELVKEGFTDDYPQIIDYNFFSPLEKSLQEICKDKLGKDLFTSKIKNVLLTSTNSWSSLTATVEGATLHLDADPSYQRDDSYIADYAGRITTALESAL